MKRALDLTLPLRFFPVLTLGKFLVTAGVFPLLYWIICQFVYVFPSPYTALFDSAMQLLRTYEGFNPLAYYRNCGIAASFCTGNTVEDAISVSTMSGVHISPGNPFGIFSYVIFPALSVTYRKIPTSLGKLRRLISRKSGAYETTTSGFIQL